MSSSTGARVHVSRIHRPEATPSERKLGNVSVVREDSKVAHAEVPRAHLADLLKAATYLDDR